MNKIKVWIANWILRNLFNSITVDDILIQDSKGFTVAGHLIPKAEMQDIHNGARTMQTMLVWKCLVNDIKYTANKMIYYNSKNEDDLIFGKAVLYTVDLMEKKLEHLSLIK